MKTNKILLSVLAVAGMLFTACSNDESVQLPQDGQAISFRTQGGMPAGMQRTTGTTTLYVDAFAVYGTDDVEDATNTANIFNGVTVARQVGGGFDYNPKKYYSAGATSSEFFAFSPVSAIRNNTITNLPTSSVFSGASFDYKVVKPDASGNTTQDDLLVAGTSIDDIAGSGTVHLQFKHALSRIFVKAKSELKEDVVITGLTLKNLLPEGTITGTPVTSSPFEWTWIWAASGTKTDYDFILAPTGVAVPAGIGADLLPPNNVPVLVTSMEQGMMVLPQVVGIADATTPPSAAVPVATDFALEVTYNVANLTAQKAYVHLPHGYAFTMGSQYAITIAFTGADLIEINFTISVADFTTPIVELP